MGDALRPAAAISGGRGRATERAGSVRGVLRRACPRAPAAAARFPSVSGRGRGAGAELVPSPFGQGRTRPKALRHWPPRRPGSSR